MRISAWACSRDLPTWTSPTSRASSTVPTWLTPLDANPFLTVTLFFLRFNLVYGYRKSIKHDGVYGQLKITVPVLRDIWPFARTVQNAIPIVTFTGVSSFTDLISNRVHRAFLWIIGILTILGNALVLGGRGLAKTENRILAMFVKVITKLGFSFL